MARDSAPEEEQPAAGNQRLARLKLFLQALKGFLLAPVLLRPILDASIGALQGWRSRLGPVTEKGGEGGESKNKRSDGHSEVAPPAVKARVLEETEARAPFVFVLALVIGFIAGMVFSFSLFSTMIVNQVNRIEAQQENISILEKENRRTQEAEARYREDLEETRKKLAETERNLNLSIYSPRRKSGARSSSPTVRAETKGTAFPEYRGNSSGLPGAASRKPGETQQSSTCDISSGNADKGMARCLDELKRK